MSHRILLLFLVWTHGLLGQINELKKASDKAEVLLGKSTATSRKIDYTQFVNPFIGTGGHGHTYPGASAPFGLMQLSPDTRHDGWDGCSGYHYSDSILYGFSHTHLSGTGVSDYADLLIVPQNAKKARTVPGYKDIQNGYGHRFSHEQEKASPGFYSVTLPDQQIKVRLAATERAGIHEYVFENQKGKRFILLDLDHRDQLLAKSFVLEGTQTVSGHRISKAWASEQHFYFHMIFSKDYEKAEYITKNGQYKLLLTFPESTDRILIRIGISGVDQEGAKRNLTEEIPDFQFNKYQNATKQKWNNELSKIAIETRSDEQMRIFYTALYHTFLQPNIWSDRDGRYRGRDQQIHQLPEGESQFTVFSLWDTYRAAHPLYTLVQSDRNRDFIKTFLRQYEEGGDLPVWELAANETECMIGYHSVSVIADAYAKGMTDFDAQKALKAMIATSNFDEFGKTAFRKNGFIETGDEPESVSKTLEYAYNDFCIAEMAKHLGNIDVYQNYYKRSLQFTSIFDPSTGFMRARKGGLWYTPFDPSEVNFNYTEANSWHYSLYAPHAIDVLIDLLGGGDSLESWLDRLFTTETEVSGRHQVDITGLIGQYAHGNEPSHHMAYLYNYTSSPHKTQEYVHRILEEMYSDQPDGLSGNEDCGQMSAWYILSGLGLYQVAPGHPWYDFGRPIITNATLQLNNHKKLTIKTLNNSFENKYIEKITWNGKVWNMNQIHHSTLAEGGELVFFMTDSIPINNRSRSVSALNSKALLNYRSTPAPFFINDTRIFDDSMTIQLAHHPSLNGENILIEYRYSSDTAQIFDYTQPFTIDQSERIQARRIDLIHHDGANSMPGTYKNYSPWITADFIKKDNNVQLQLLSNYSSQYAASGPNSLIDGIRGGKEFRTGEWQGFWAQDVDVEVSFIKEMSIRSIEIGLLSDRKSWIFLPKEIQLKISYDGEKYEVEKIIPIEDEPYSEMRPHRVEIRHLLQSDQPVKKVKLVAENYGKCPDWHEGAGNDTWIFIDEISFTEEDR